MFSAFESHQVGVSAVCIVSVGIVHTQWDESERRKEGGKGGIYTETSETSMK